MALPPIWGEAILQLRKCVAMYELLHAHARDETDFTEDQLANVVTGIAEEAAEMVRRMQAYEAEHAPAPHRQAAPGHGGVCG